MNCPPPTKDDIGPMIAQFLWFAFSLNKDGVAIGGRPAVHASRIAVVYDPGSSSLFPLAVALLPRETEAAYRARITQDSDYEWLWNPAEFPLYATPDLLINLPEDLVGDLSLEEARAHILKGCSLANDLLGQHGCFAFATDPELVDARANVAAIQGIPATLKTEIPSWF